MGSRTLPTECEHGVVLDWGDFGPNPDDGMVGVVPCPECQLAEALKPYSASVLIEWHPSASIGETDHVQHLVQGWCGRLMEELLELGVVDPTVELDMSSVVPADQPRVVHTTRHQWFAGTAHTEAEALAQLNSEEAADG